MRFGAVLPNFIAALFFVSNCQNVVSTACGPTAFNPALL